MNHRTQVSGSPLWSSQGCREGANTVVSESPRISFLAGALSRRAGGMFGAMSGLAGALSGLGLKVSAYGAEVVDERSDLLAWRPAQAIPLRRIGPSAYSYMPELTSRLKVDAPDLVHLHGLWMYPSRASVRWHRRTNSPYIISPHGMLDPWAVANAGWKKRMARLLYERANLSTATALHALTMDEAAALRAYGLRQPIAVIPNGVAVPDRRTWRNAGPWLGVQAKSKVLLYLGRLHPKKGLPSLLRAWASVAPDKRRNWTLVVAGWSQVGHEDELKSVAASLGIADSVRFPGPLYGDAKEAAFARADAFVLPSLSEGLPMAVLEAWARGLPAIVTPACNLDIGVRRGAAICAEADPTALSIAVERLIGMSDNERRAMGLIGCSLVRERFTWPIVATQMSEVYRWMIDPARPMPSCVHLGDI